MATTEELLANLEKLIFKVYFSVLSYTLLDVVDRLNLELQSESPKIHLLLDRVKDLYRSILRNFIQKNYLDRVPLVRINPSDPRNFLQLDEIYFGVKTEILLPSENLTPEEIKNFELRSLEFYIELCQEIKKKI